MWPVTIENTYYDTNKINKYGKYTVNFFSKTKTDDAMQTSGYNFGIN